MHLRQLRIGDAPLMLSWMHDSSVVENLYTDFASKNITDCENFINYANRLSSELHLAIASDSDEYMGTVSLKHVDYTNSNAEFAITIRAEAMGKGYSWFAMKKIITKAFYELNIDSIYWCVSPLNQRAIRFYDKHAFKKTLYAPSDIRNRYSDNIDLIWYSISKHEVQVLNP